MTIEQWVLSVVLSLFLGGGTSLLILAALFPYMVMSISVSSALAFFFAALSFALWKEAYRRNHTP